MSEQPRVIVCGGGMVIISGMERLTFEVVRALRSKGVAVHFILNCWGNERIRPFVDELGASWSTGRYLVEFDRHTRNPVRILRLAWDILLTSLGMLRDSFRFRATHVFVPELGAVVRNAPALAFLRVLGLPVIMRTPNAPSHGRFHELLWRKLVSPLVTRVVEGGKTLVYEAAWARSCGKPVERLAPMAKLFACQVFRDTTAMAQQVWGGVGFTLEYDIQLYFRRAKQLQLSWWDARTLAERVAATVLDGEHA